MYGHDTTSRVIFCGLLSAGCPRMCEFVTADIMILTRMSTGFSGPVNDLAGTVRGGRLKGCHLRLIDQSIVFRSHFNIAPGSTNPIIVDRSNPWRSCSNWRNRCRLPLNRSVYRSVRRQRRLCISHIHPGVVQMRGNNGIFGRGIIRCSTPSPVGAVIMIP